MAELSAMAEETEITLEGTTFSFGKLPAWPKGIRLLEAIRVELGRSGERALVSAVQDVSAGGQAAGLGLMRDLVMLILGLSEPFVTRLQKELFEAVTFTTPKSTSQKLAGAELIAFAGCSPMTVYEVTFRALVVNFFGSWRRLVSFLPGETEATSQ